MKRGFLFFYSLYTEMSFKALLKLLSQQSLRSMRNEKCVPTCRIRHVTATILTLQISTAGIRRWDNLLLDRSPKIMSTIFHNRRT